MYTGYCHFNQRCSNDINFLIICKYNNIFYIDSNITFLTIRELIDTGSSVNIISEELYKSLPNSKKSDITVNIKDAIVLANNQKIDVIVPCGPHVVPVSLQAVAIFGTMTPFRTKLTLNNIMSF
jgi:hypothetical protein